MSGNAIGGKKTAQANLAKNPNYYSDIGKIGGKSGKAEGTIKGFATMSSEKRLLAGRKGGLTSRKGRAVKATHTVVRLTPFIEPKRSFWDKLFRRHK